MLFLKKKVFNIHPRPFGLDISDLSLKAAWMDTEGRTDQVKSFGSVALPHGMIVDGEIVRPDIVSETLQSFLSKGVGPGRIRTRDVVCSIPEMKAFLRLIFVPRMDEEELRKALQWELEGNIPLPIDQIYYDFQVLGEEMNFSADPKKVAVLVVAVARHVVDQFIEVVEHSGLRVVGLETESVAQARVLVSDSKKLETSLIVDIGDRRTSFFIAIGGVPIFTSSSSLSSQMVSDSIAKAYRVSDEEAERMKIEYGIGSKRSGQSLLEAIRPVLESLAVEIERSMDFYLNSLHYSPSIDRILLCGGGSNLQGIVPYLAKRLQRPVEMGDPWVNFSLGEGLPPIPYGDAVRYSTALGLASGTYTL